MGALGWWLLVGAWIAVGLIVAGVLTRQGHPPAAAIAAVPCWPLLVPLLSAGTRLDAPGPTQDRIDATVDRLARTLAEQGDRLDLTSLRASLRRADRRLGRFDLLLADATDAHPDDLLRLRAARAETARELEDVLAELVRLRLQLGLAHLAADGGRLRARLVELSARVGSWEELAGGNGPREAASPVSDRRAP